MVSCVVNVLDAITKSVVSGLHFFKTSAMWVPSMLDTKCTLGPTWKGLRASVTMSGPCLEYKIGLIVISRWHMPIDI